MKKDSSSTPKVIYIERALLLESSISFLTNPSETLYNTIMKHGLEFLDSKFVKHPSSDLIVDTIKKQYESTLAMESIIKNLINEQEA